MQSQQLKLDVISNNLANVNTTGYKRAKIEFQDLLYQTLRVPGADQGNGNQLPTGLQVGHGAQAVATSRVFSTGKLNLTGSPYDVAIQGDGFFEVEMPDGSSAYTRDGGLKRSADGRVTTNDGLPLKGWGNIPAGTTSISISPTGVVTVTGTTRSTFNVQLTRFTNPEGLESMGRNLFRETAASGNPELGNPGENGYGTLDQGYLEMSNVEIVEEMVSMIVAQRAYEINSKAVQASDEMMQWANNLRR